MLCLCLCLAFLLGCLVLFVCVCKNGQGLVQGLGRSCALVCFRVVFVFGVSSWLFCVLCVVVVCSLCVCVCARTVRVLFRVSGVLVRWDCFRDVFASVVWGLSLVVLGYSSVCVCV